MNCSVCKKPPSTDVENSANAFWHGSSPAVGSIVGEGQSGNSAVWAWDRSTGLKDVIEALSAIGLESNITTMPRESLRRPMRKV
jgi:hypothetical protein